MKYCTNCGEEVSGNFCAHCGTQVNQENSVVDSCEKNTTEETKITTTDKTDGTVEKTPEQKREEEAAQKFLGKYRIVSLLKNILFLALAVVTVFFIPFAKIGPVSMGTPFEIIKHFVLKDVESINHLSIYVILGVGGTILACVIMVITLLTKIIPYCIAKPTVIKSPSIKLPSIIILFLSPCVLFLIAYFVYFNQVGEYYQCTFYAPYIAIVLIAYVDLIDNVFYYVCERKHPTIYHVPEKTTLSKKEKRDLIGFAISLTVFVAIIGAVIGYKTDWFSPAKMTIKTFKASDLYSQEALKVGEYKYNSITITCSDGEEVHINSNTKDVILYGENYLYYVEKIKELEEEAKTLMPDEDDSMEDYFEKLKALTDQRDYMKNVLESMSYNYTKMKFDNGLLRSYAQDFDSNSHDENGYKWNYYENKIVDEKIELSKTTFEKGTDFADEIIIAKVYYSDGSLKESIITPTNVNELNNASGKAVLKWSDNWGEYEVEISID